MQTGHNEPTPENTQKETHEAPTHQAGANTADSSGGGSANNSAGNDSGEAINGSGSDQPTSNGPSATDLKIAVLEALVKEKEQKYLYLYADFENFKRRQVKERSDLMKFGCENIARDLLEVVDNLERALGHANPQNGSTADSLIQGLQLVLSQFKNALEKQGVQGIQSVNQTFDPNLHEAVGQAPSEKPAGVITAEHQKGYTLHGRLLRPSRVLISTGPTN